MNTALTFGFAAFVFVVSFGLIAWNTRRGLLYAGTAEAPSRVYRPTLTNTIVPAIAGAALSTGLALPALLSETPHLLLALAWGTMCAALLANFVTDLLKHDVWLDVVFGATALVVVFGTADALLVGGNRGALDSLVGMLALGGISYVLQRGATLWARLRGLQRDEADADADYGFGDTAAWLLIGAALGWQFGLMAFFASVFIHGLIVAVPVLVWNLITRRGWFSTHVPMLPAIAVATLLVLARYGGVLEFTILGF